MVEYDWVSAFKRLISTCLAVKAAAWQARFRIRTSMENAQHITCGTYCSGGIAAAVEFVQNI